MCAKISPLCLNTSTTHTDLVYEARFCSLNSGKMCSLLSCYRVTGGSFQVRQPRLNSHSKDNRIISKRFLHSRPNIVIVELAILWCLFLPDFTITMVFMAAVAAVAAMRYFCVCVCVFGNQHCTYLFIIMFDMGKAKPLAHVGRMLLKK